MAENGIITFLKRLTSPNAPSVGKLNLYAKDGGLLYTKDDAGNEKLLIHSFGGYIPGIYLIESITLESDGTITFSNIPQIFQHLTIIGKARATRASTNDALQLRFNGDSGTNYANTYLNGRGDGTVSSGYNNAANGVGITILDAANSEANAFTSVDITIGNYRDDTFKSVTSKFGYTVGTPSSTTTYVQSRGGLWRSTDAITSILCRGELTTNLKAKTTLSLYGLIA